MAAAEPYRCPSLPTAVNAHAWANGPYVENMVEDRLEGGKTDIFWSKSFFSTQRWSQKNKFQARKAPKSRQTAQKQAKRNSFGVFVY